MIHIVAPNVERDAEQPIAQKRPATTARRFVVACAVLIATAAFVQLSPIKSLLREHPDVVSTLGPAAYPLACFAIALLIACGVPRLLLCAAAGATCGFWIGLSLVEIGAIAGAYGLFCFTRWGGREYVLHRWPRLRALATIVGGQGVMGVILLRQLPLHGMLTNVCLGISHVKHRQFLVGTAIGLLPEAIPATLIGAGAAAATSPQRLIAYFGAAAAAFALIWIVASSLARSLGRNRAAGAIAAEVNAIT